MESKTNWFSRVLIIILIIFIAVLVMGSFILGEPKFSLTTEIILLILLLIVLALSEVFDNFSIGSLITAKKEKDEKEVELNEAKTENRELRTQLISIVSNTITNRNMNIFGLSKDDLAQISGVEQADPTAVEEKKEDDLAADKKNVADDFRKRHRMAPKIEKLALDRFCTDHKIPILSVVDDVQFSNGFIGIDPIMDKNAIFDAYYKSAQEELFIEIKINFPLAYMNMYMYNLYYLLSKVYYYRKANQLHAKVVLIVPNLPESYWNDRRHPDVTEIISNLQKPFAPAIMINLLEIVPIEITQNDLDIINKELETEERGSGK